VEAALEVALEMRRETATHSLIERG
jgi:hypothetical protein